jgi:hypothetical protein
MSPEPICVDNLIRCDSPPERVGRTAIEAQIIEPNAQEQFQPRPHLAEDLPAGIRTAARRLDRPKERVQLVEMELADVVDGFAIDGEQQPGGTHARPVAVGTA